ncbi:MAG: hypothetical protein GX139_10160 [Armatimonadetes bacterium]|nr:hypothetical protein [Armatimonadota bacterium]
MKKIKLLLLDSNVVITLCELGLWNKVLNRCDIHLAGSIIEDEALYYRDGQGSEHPIDLSADIASGELTRYDVDASDVHAFKNRFRPGYFDALHAGESESLAYLVTCKEEFTICSGDKIVYRVLGALLLKDRGISLEEVLQQIGESPKVNYEYSKRYREHWSGEGFREGLQGMA